jgi:hypothetical protein
MSFDWSEFDDNGEEPAAVVNNSAKQAALSEEFDELTDLDDQLEDVEKRLEVAGLYRLLLKDRIFEEDSAAARQVEGRIRRFVKDELKSLLGLAQPTAIAPPHLSSLTPERIQALVQLADKVLEKTAAGSSSPSPGLRHVPQQAAPQAVRTIKPNVAQPQPPVAAKKAPQPATPPANPGALTARQPKRRQKKVFQEQALGEDKAVTVGQGNGRIVKEYFDKDGKSLGTRDVTPQVRSPTSLGMPQTSTQFSQIVEQQAMQSVMAAGASVSIDSVK